MGAHCDIGAYEKATVPFTDDPLIVGVTLIRAVHVTELRTRINSIRGLFGDRKSTRLNSSHSQISYAVFCLKKKKKSQPSSSLHAQTTSSDSSQQISEITQPDRSAPLQALSLVCSTSTRQHHLRSRSPIPAL